jgi:acetone carboxylase gamma subunit
MNAEAKRCDNLACLCTVEATEAVCSPYCDSPDARDSAIITCSCGHAACAAEIDEQLHGGIGKETL